MTVSTTTGTRTDAGVRRAGSRDHDPLISLLVASALSTAHGRYLIADEHARPHILRRYARMIVPYALTHGRVDVIGSGEAAAIWYHVDGPSTPRIPGYAARLAEITGGVHLARFVELDRARTTHHPAGPPHDHLVYLAVHPSSRGRGLAGRLLEHRHRDLDARGGHAYAEATGTDSRLFARYGYEPLPPYLPGLGAPALHPMWRHPRE
ncbi:GNAT family N-acetyltransferase [Actinoplanes sp. CA-054009]